MTKLDLKNAGEGGVEAFDMFHLDEDSNCIAYYLYL